MTSPSPRNRRTTARNFTPAATVIDLRPTARWLPVALVVAAFLAGGPAPTISVLQAEETSESISHLKWIRKGTLPPRGTAQHNLTLAKLTGRSLTDGEANPDSSVTVLRWRTPGVARTRNASDSSQTSFSVITVSGVLDDRGAVRRASGILSDIPPATGPVADIPTAQGDAFADPFRDGRRAPAPPQELPPAAVSVEAAPRFIAHDPQTQPAMEVPGQLSALASGASDEMLDDPAPEPLPSPDGHCDRVYNRRDCCIEEERCDTARTHWERDAISKISLDITPNLHSAASDPSEEEAVRSRHLAAAPIRTWHDRQGNVLASGRITNIKRGRLLILDANNQILKLPFNDLSDDDLCFLTAWWKVPTECALTDEAFAGRAWQPLTFTWKASGACHKPLYFEETQLERYGHTAGPLKQPVLSGAHFFLNLVTLPYQAGINPPWECRYALGYYRPGNCAPWLVPPIPLSVRGALAQAGAIVGGVAIFP